MSESVKKRCYLHRIRVVARRVLYRAAIVGAASLKGKEVAEMLSERKFSGDRYKACSTTTRRMGQAGSLGPMK